MEKSLSRRSILAGGAAALCGLAIPRAVLADTVDNTSGTLSEIKDLFGKLSDDELLEVDDLLRDEKESRGVQSLPIGTGIYVADIDIDPGSYLIKVRPSEPDGRVYVTFTLEEANESGDDWDQLSWDLVTSPTDYNFTVREGVRLDIDISDGKCVIFPAKKISF